jgi:hypothetical protein
MKKMFCFLNSWLEKKGEFFCLIFLFLTLFSYPLPAFAFWESIANALLAIPFLIISVVLMFFVLLTGAIALLCGKILDIVIDPSLLSLSYTNPTNNQIIKVGLEITQSFVNLILVLILVYTALAIALKINESQAKRSLVRIIVVALLVNFAPVFCGLVIDGANIVMYFFLEPVKGGASGFLLQIRTQWDVIVHDIWSVATRITESLEVIMMAITQILVNISIGIAFLLYAVLFLFRYVAIWILVILAPIAFAAWAVAPVAPEPETVIGFPITSFVSAIASRFKKLWDLWLTQFIEWAIVGIPLAFFLYLSISSLDIMRNAFRQKVELPGVETKAVGFLDEVFPYFVILGFLYLGFGIGLQTGAMGTQALIAGFRAARSRAQSITLRRLRETTTRMLRETTTALGGAVRYPLTRLQQQQRFPRLARGAGIILGIPGAVRRAGGVVRRIPTLPVVRGVYNAIRDVAITGLTAAGIRRPRERPTCPRCGSYISRGMRRCPECGLEMPTCPNCNAYVLPDDKFCQNCGAEIQARGKTSEEETPEEPIITLPREVWRCPWCNVPLERVSPGTKRCPRCRRVFRAED